MLDRARALLADLSCSLEGEIDRLKDAMETETEAATDPGRTKVLAEVIRMNQKALQTVLDQEAKLMGEAVGRRPGRDVIDLAEARAEIGRRLDRLAR